MAEAIIQFSAVLIFFAIAFSVVRLVIGRTLIDRIVATTGKSADDARAALQRTNPQGRFVQPGEVAAAVLYLCGAWAGSVTGQCLSVSGGETW